MSTSHTTKLVRRPLALTAAFAMTFALVPGTAFADHISPQDSVCPPPAGYEQNAVDFTDHENDIHENNIECVAQYGIAQGYSDDTYRPDVDIRRDQMATFIANLIRTANVDGSELPAGESAFGDTGESVHEDNIDALAAAEVVVGTGDNNYSPNRTVSRAAMATFISNAIDYVDNGDVDGSIPPMSADEFFEDVDGNVHESNINRLANVHVVLGTGNNDYSPDRTVVRANMATFIMNAAAYLDAEGLWHPVVAMASNQTFTVTPADAEILGPDEVRQYVASGLDADDEYRITLVDADNIDVDADGIVTFTEDADTGLAAAGTVESDLTVVNGVAVAADSQTAGGISPQSDGNISFTVETADSFEEFVPVVYTDGGDNTRLEIDADGLPIEDFGIGGAVTVLPDEAADGAVAFPVEILAVDKDADFIVGEDAAGVDNVYFYDANDDFFDDVAMGAADELDIDEFEAILTIGDNLDDGTEYQDNESLSSTFVLDNIEPGQLDITASTATDTTVELTIEEDDVNDDATVEVYYAETADALNIDADTEDFTVVTATVDEDADEDDFQVTVTGLDETTPYDLYARQVTDEGEEGDFSVVETETTLAAGDVADLVSENAVVTNSVDLLGEAVATDVWEIGFNRAIDAQVSATGEIAVQDADGDQDVVQCAVGGNTCLRNAAALTFEGETYEAGELLTVTLGADLMDGTDALDYPLTVIASEDVYADDVDATNTWDLSASADVTLNVDETAGSEDDITPTATDATFVDDATDADDDFGDDVGDVITVTYDEAVVEDGVTTITVDGVTYTDGTGVTIAAAGTTLTVTVTDLAAAPDVTIVDGTSEVDGTTNVEDAAGNAAAGYPEVIN